MRKLSKRSKLGLLAIIFSVFLIDLQMEKDSAIITAGTFLGTGVEVKEGKCIMGVRVLTKQAKLFGIPVGDTWTKTKPC